MRKNNIYETPKVVVTRFDVQTRTMVDLIDGDIIDQGDPDVSTPEPTTLPDLPHLGL